MLDGYGLHQLTWDTCDERFGDVLVASHADAEGRGISLAVRQSGAAANLTGATVCLVWRHKVTGERGAEPFTAVNAAGGTFAVYYPAAMQEAEGAVQAQVMVSRGDDTYISSRVFTIRVEPVIVGGQEHEDGFTLFVDAINAYEHALDEAFPLDQTVDAVDAPHERGAPVHERERAEPHVRVRRLGVPEGRRDRRCEEGDYECHVRLLPPRWPADA